MTRDIHEIGGVALQQPAQRVSADRLVLKKSCPTAAFLAIAEPAIMHSVGERGSGKRQRRKPVSSLLAHRGRILPTVRRQVQVGHVVGTATPTGAVPLGRGAARQIAANSANKKRRRKKASGTAAIAMVIATPLYFCGPWPSEPGLNDHSGALYSSSTT